MEVGPCVGGGYVVCKLLVVIVNIVRSDEMVVVKEGKVARDATRERGLVCARAFVCGGGGLVRIGRRVVVMREGVRVAVVWWVLGRWCGERAGVGGGVGCSRGGRKGDLGGFADGKRCAPWIYKKKRTAGVFPTSSKPHKLRTTRKGGRTKKKKRSRSQDRVRTKDRAGTCIISSIYLRPANGSTPIHRDEFHLHKRASPRSPSIHIHQALSLNADISKQQTHEAERRAPRHNGWDPGYPQSSHFGFFFFLSLLVRLPAAFSGHRLP